MFALYLILLSINASLGINMVTLNLEVENLNYNESALLHNDIGIGDIVQQNKFLNSPKKMLLHNFIPMMLNISVSILDTVESNIKNNYALNSIEIQHITEAFKISKIEYYFMLKSNLNKLKGIEYKSKDIFLLDFVDLSNFLLQSIIQNNLDKLKGKLDKPLKWCKHLLKHMILRQQIKIAINLIEIKICYHFSICVKKVKYTEYLIECLRLLINVDAIKLSIFFRDVTDLLVQFMHSIRINQKFREKAKLLLRYGSVFQRNLLDLIDETIIEPATVVHVTDPHLKKAVITLRALFQLIDDNYDLNHINEWKMNKLLETFIKWTEHDKNIELKDILIGLLDNMQQNVQIWPRAVLTKLEYIWSKIILL